MIICKAKQTITVTIQTIVTLCTLIQIMTYWNLFITLHENNISNNNLAPVFLNQTSLFKDGRPSVVDFLVSLVSPLLHEESIKTVNELSILLQYKCN